MGFQGLKVGDLARMTGLTVRCASSLRRGWPAETVAAYRLWSSPLHVRRCARLQQIVSLREIGFSLEEIRAFDKAEFAPWRRSASISSAVASGSNESAGLCKRLEAIAGHLRVADEVSADEFLRTIKEMIMIENYYTAEQLEYLKKRADQVGEERMKQVPGEWAQLIAQVRSEMEKGTDPRSPEVLALARRWQGLINEFTGGDPGIEHSVGRLWKEQGDSLVKRHGAEYDSRGLSEYIGQAIAAVKGGN